MPEGLRQRTASRLDAAGGTLRLLRGALVASVLVPAALFGIAAVHERQRVLDDALTGAGDTVAVLREHALKAIETHELLVREADRRIRGMNWDEIRAAAPILAQELREMHAGLPQVSALGITDAEGRQWAASVAPLDGDYTVVSHREFWSAHKSADAGTFVSRSYVGLNTRRVNFGISRRRSSVSGIFDGTVNVAVTTSYFSDFWAEVMRGREGSIALIRTDGEVLARYPASSEPLPRVSPSASPVMRAVEVGQTSGVLRGRSGIDGVERVVGFARVGSYPVLVTFGMSEEAVFAGWKRSLVVLAGVFGFVALALATLVLLAIRQTRKLVAGLEELDEAAAGAQQGQRLETIGRLAADLTHDLNNVVQAVIAAARLIGKSADDPARMRSIGTMLEDAASRGGRITRQLLDLARRETPRLEDDADGAVAFDAAEAVSAVCTILATSLGPNHPLLLHVERDRLPGLVRGDRSGLEAAVLNLASNARDAMPDGGDVAIRVAAHADAEGERFARISVSDRGQGMPPDVLARAGEPFFTTKPRGRGTGLGLAAVKAYAERAGGRLEIDSKLGEGTTASVLLPAVSGSTKAEDGKVVQLSLRRTDGRI